MKKTKTKPEKVELKNCSTCNQATLYENSFYCKLRMKDEFDFWKFTRVKNEDCKYFKIKDKR